MRRRIPATLSRFGGPRLDSQRPAFLPVPWLAMKPWTELAARFRFHSTELRSLVTAFEAEQWTQPLEPGIDPPVFALGHLAATRRKMLRRMGHDLSLDPWEAAFAKGPFEGEPDDCPPPASLCSDFLANGEVLAAELEEMSLEDGRVAWGGRSPDGSETLCGMLAFLSTDEARHLGRLGLLAELLGLETRAR